MRTREEIESNINDGIKHVNRFASNDYEFFAITTEILLDIRDQQQEILKALYDRDR